MNFPFIFRDIYNAKGNTEEEEWHEEEEGVAVEVEHPKKACQGNHEEIAH